MKQTGLQGEELTQCIDIFTSMDEDGDGQMTLAEAAEADEAGGGGGATGGHEGGDEGGGGDNLTRMLAKMALSNEEKALRRAALEELALSVDTLLDHIHIKASQVDPVT